WCRQRLPIMHAVSVISFLQGPLAELSQCLLRGVLSVRGALFSMFCLAISANGAAVSQEQNGDCRAQIALAQPVTGRPIVGFGEHGTHGARSRGIVFESQYGADVRAPVAGIVVYAAEFRSYGKLVTIAVGCEAHVLIAGLGNIVVSLGDRVTTGQTLGTTSQ